MRLTQAMVKNFSEAAKDSGDTNAISAARRLWWAAMYPRTKGHVASKADWDMLRAFEA